MSQFMQVGSQVRVLWAGGDSPRFSVAHVLHVDGEMAELRLEDLLEVQRNAHVIVEIPAAEEPIRIICAVMLQSGLRLRLEQVDHPPRERRAWPRIEASLSFRYRPADIDEVAPWLAGEPMPGHLHEPAMVSDFSVTGLAFDDVLPVHAEQTLLVELAIPDQGEHWRGTVRVVRCLRLPDKGGNAHRGPVHRVACTFTTLPEAAVWALVQYTLRLQGTHEISLFSEAGPAPRLLGAASW